MKRVLAIILTALIIITAMPLVVLAENSADLQHIYVIDNGERSCTEEEFRELVVEEPKLVLSKSWSYNSLNLDSKGYYYTYLSSSFEKKIYNGCYNITPTNSTYEVSFDDLNGYKFETAAFEEAYENLLTSVWKGMFCYRLDNPYNCDSFSNEVAVADARVSCGENNIVNKMYITIKMANHPSYEPKQITQRNERIAEIAEIANRQKTPYSKLKAIYEEIIKTSQYDFSDQAQKIDHINTEVFYYAHNSLGVLNKGLGVCESYAKAFKLVCDYMDIAPCILLTSTTHMWNVVYLDGAWYGLDATWDDPGDGDGVRYQYFLCGDPDVVDGSQTSHIPDAMYTTPPDYSDTPYVSCDEGHKQVIVPGTPATCTMTGTTDRVYCSVCGETITASTVIGKLPHTITYVPEVAATYYSTGNKSHYKCTVCKGLFSDKNGVNQITAESVIIPQLTQEIICEHLHYTDIPATPATTEKSGLSAGRVCDLCETVIIAQQEIPRIASIKASKDKYTYTGKAIKPGVVITDELGATISSSNYTLTYSSGLKLPGTYTITVKFKGKYSGTHKCSFKIIISNPSPKASTSTSSVKLSWGKVSGASGYIVYDANKKKIKDVGSATSYTISKRKAGTTYTYYVRTYKKISGKAYYSDYVKITTSTLPAAPKVSASSSTSAIKYTWGKVSGASGYEVYNDSKKVIKDCGNTTSYTLSGRKAGTSYSVYMRAYRTVSGKRYYSSYVNVSCSTKPANPVVNTSSTTSSIKYSWGKVSGATGYIVYNGSKKVISDRKTSTSYSLTKRSSATTYTVYVRAYRKTLGKTFYSDYVKVTTSTLPAAPKVSASSSTSAIKYTWGKVSGASGYEVYNGSKKVIKDCGNTTSYTLSGCKAGTSYSVYMRAYRTVSGKRYYSSYIKVSYSTKPANPAVTASTSTSTVKLSWGKVTGASGYIVYDANKKKISDRKTATSYSISSRKAGTTYTYYVRAYRKALSKTFYSDYVKITSTTLPATPSLKASSNTTTIKLTWGKVAGASGYEIYNSSKTLIKDSASASTLSYSVTGNKVGTKYTFYVRAYKVLSGKKYYSGYAKVSYATKPSFNESSVAVGVGKTYKLSLNTTASTITWATSDKSIATVSSTGVVTGKKKGTATITATANGQKATIKVVVSTVSYKLDVTSCTLAPCHTYSLGVYTNLSSPANKWESSNPDVAIVSSSGIVLAISEGQTVITVSVNYGGITYKDTCIVTVEIPTYTKYGFDSVPDLAAAVGNNILPRKETCQYGEEAYLTYRSIDIDWDEQYELSLDIYREYLYQKGFQYIDTVDGGTKVNPCTISAYRNDSEGILIWLIRWTADGNIDIYISKYKITLSETSINLIPGYYSTISAEPTIGDITILWSSSNPSVAYVEIEDNEVHIVAEQEGTATITAYFENGGVKYSATCTVTVKIPTYSGYSFDNVPDFSASLGSAFTLKGVYDRSSDTEFLYGRSNAISAEEYEVLFAQYREFLALKGFTFLEKGTTTQGGWPCTVEYYQNSATGTRLMFVLFDDGDVSIVILK